MLDIIGNLKIDESKPNRVDYFLACLRSWAFFKDHCSVYLNLDSASDDLLRQVKRVYEECGYSGKVETITSDNYGQVYCGLINAGQNKFVLNFIEDHFAVINEPARMAAILGEMLDHQVDVLKATFFQVEQTSLQQVKGTDTDHGRVFKMNSANHHAYGMPYGGRYMIGVNFLTTRDFALRFWNRDCGHRPHEYEIGQFSSQWEHTCMIPSIELLAAVEDDHGADGSCLLKRSEPKWAYVFEDKKSMPPSYQAAVEAVLPREEKIETQPVIVPKRSFPKDSKFVFNDLRSENAVYDDEIVKRVNEVIYSGIYLFGKQTEEFEASFAKYNNRKYCVTVKNCTDAIMLVLRYILRHKPDRTVILPNFGAYPTAIAAKNCTDNLRFVDVDESFTMDVTKLPDIQNGIIIPVHLFGNNANMRGIFKYSHANKHIIIEDCAQSTGSGSGSVGDFSVFSFYPTKPLGTMGDGGAICTNDKDAYEELLSMRFYGLPPLSSGRGAGGEVEYAGLNSRMGELEAAVLYAKLPTFEQMIDKRRQIASRYKKIITGLRINSNCVYHQFPMLFNERDKITAEMDQRGIPYMIHYPHHISEMPVFAAFSGGQPSRKGEGWERSSRAGDEVGFRVNDKILSLPCHPFMTESQVQQVEEFLNDHKQYEY